MNNKKFIGVIAVVFLIIALPLLFANKKEKSNENDVEPELYVEQIWFKNIEILDNIPIDQSLLIQDEITYYFQNQNKDIEELELLEGSFKDLGNHKLEFNAEYEGGAIKVLVDKDKVTIKDILD